jgi:hypothetical protein
VELIRQEKIDEADHVRLDLVAQGALIPTNNIFVRAVEILLQQPDYLSRESSLISWLSLCPKAKDKDDMAFRVVCTMLFSDPAVNMDLIAAFGRVCASKGYTSMVQDEVIPTILEFAPAERKEHLVKSIRAEMNEFVKNQVARRDLDSFAQSGATLPGEHISYILGHTKLIW